MTSSDVFLVTLSGVWSVGALLIGWRVHRQAERNRARYRLFAVRDQLQMLVVTGEVKESAAGYRLLCIMVNQVIAESEEYTASRMLKVFAAADRRATGDQERVFVTAMKSSPEPVLDVAVAFYAAIRETVLHNSPWLRVAVGCWKLSRHHSTRAKALVGKWALARRWQRLQSRLSTATAMRDERRDLTAPGHLAPA